MIVLFSEAKYRSKIEYFRAVYNCKRSDLATTKKIALLNAKTEIASNINSLIKVVISKAYNENDEFIYELKFFYKNKPVNKLSYTYHVSNGTYSKLISLNNSIGLIELYGNQKEQENLIIQIEYLFKDEAIVDGDLTTLVTQFEHPVKHARFTIQIDKSQTQKFENNNSEKNLGFVTNIYKITKSDGNLNVHKPNNKEDTLTSGKATEIINSLIQNIKYENFEDVKKNCTPEAWEEFEKIIKQGNARVLSPEANEIKLYKWQNKTIIRPITIKFSFKNNYKDFTESLIITLNKEGKIERFNLGLSKQAFESIQNSNYTSVEKLNLINALETYKTAFFIKDISFLNAIFDENAYIIIGKVMTEYKNGKPETTNHLIRTNKRDYISSLQKLFKSNEYVNLKFDKSDITKTNVGNIFGIHIQQTYFSAHYGDQGNLFLIMDLDNPNQPIIKVRTWQPLQDTSKPITIFNYRDFLQK